MVTLIILTAVVICLLALLIAILYMRNEEVQVTDKATDLADILPIQTITQDAIINGNGDITVGYRMLLPEVFTLSEKEAEYIHERLEALLKMLPAELSSISRFFIIPESITIRNIQTTL